MGCNYPVGAYRLHSGEVVFSLKKGFDLKTELKLPCGQCTGCKMEKAKQWAIRCMHEAKMHEQNSFVTLTYNDENMPADRSLDYYEFQKFMKRLRKYFKQSKIRFYMCGEYGSENDRPHYHALLFGLDFADKKLFKTVNGNKIYTSKILQDLWPHGFTTVGNCDYESAKYVAMYIMKKQNGKRSTLDYQIQDPESGEIRLKCKEFAHMSLKPGIGSRWYEKYKSEVFPFDRTIMEGRALKPPKYYFKKLAEQDPETFEQVTQDREKKAKLYEHDNTEARLLVKEKCLKARLDFGSQRKL